jgi:hypothetical protein
MMKKSNPPISAKNMARQEKIKAAVEELRLRIPHLPPGIIFKKKSPGCSNASPPSDRSTSPNARSSAIVPGSQGPHLATSPN